MTAAVHSMSFSLMMADRAHAYTWDQLRAKGNRVSTKAEKAESQKAKDKVGRLREDRPPQLRRS
jgi:hypothetical protein